MKIKISLFCIMTVLLSVALCSCTQTENIQEMTASTMSEAGMVTEYQQGSEALSGEDGHTEGQKTTLTTAEETVVETEFEQEGEMEIIEETIDEGISGPNDTPIL